MPTPPALFRIISGKFRTKFGNDDPERDVRWVPADPGVCVEVGTGGGYYTEALDRRLGPKATFVTLDLSAAHLRHVRRRCHRGGGSVHGICGDGTRLPFADESIDCLFYSYSFEEIPDTQGALEEITRVVRPGGSVIMFLWRPIARRRKTMQLVDAHMSRHFDLGPSSRGPQNVRQLWTKTQSGGLAT